MADREQKFDGESIRDVVQVVSSFIRGVKDSVVSAAQGITDKGDKGAAATKRLDSGSARMQGSVRGAASHVASGRMAGAKPESTSTKRPKNPPGSGGRARTSESAYYK